MQAGTHLVLAHLARLALRVADHHGALVGQPDGVVEHHLQLLRARRSEDAHARHLGEQRHVVHAVVAGPVVAGDAGTIEAEDHREAVERHVVDHLVPSPAEERAVERHDRTQAAHRHACSSGDRMLLGDADVEEPIGEAALERQEARGTRHGRRHRHHLRVGLGLLDDGVGEHLRVATGHRRRWPDQRVEHGRVVQVLLVVVLGGQITTPLLSEHVDDDRTLGRQFDRVAEGGLEALEMVAVDGADVAHAQRLEECRWLQELAHGGLHRLDTLFGLRSDVREVLDELLESTLPAYVGGIEPDARERV